MWSENRLQMSIHTRTRQQGLVCILMVQEQKKHNFMLKIFFKNHQRWKTETIYYGFFHFTVLQRFNVLFFFINERMKQFTSKHKMLLQLHFKYICILFMAHSSAYNMQFWQSQIGAILLFLVKLTNVSIPVLFFNVCTVFQTVQARFILLNFSPRARNPGLNPRGIKPPLFLGQQIC